MGGWFREAGEGGRGRGRGRMSVMYICVLHKTYFNLFRYSLFVSRLEFIPFI